MSKSTISTLEELTEYLRSTVSERRFVHSLGVAKTAKQVLEHYGLHDYEESWKGFDAPLFCGIAHDLAREMSDGSILQYCKENHITISKEDIRTPVLAHGLVSAEIARTLVGNFPLSWYKALCVHTTGNTSMDSLALALFIADYIEPSRKFMTEEKRSFYLGSKSIYLCAYRILCDMIGHWEQTGMSSISDCSFAMKRELEKEHGCRYED